MYRINIRYNSDEEMMLIEDNKGKELFYGNYSDFDNSPLGLYNFLEQFTEVTLTRNLPLIDEE